MWVDRGSANETPAFTIGECFVNQPDFIIQQVRLLKNSDLRTMIFDDIEHGLDFYYDFDIYPDRTTEKELQKLKKLQNKLENARK